MLKYIEFIMKMHILTIHGRYMDDYSTCFIRLYAFYAFATVEAFHISHYDIVEIV